MKNKLGWNGLSGTGRLKIEAAIRNGWQPGLRPSDFFRVTRHTRRTRLEAGEHGK
jgi:hypothetical protein